MKLRGIANVRGWRYVSETLSSRDMADIKREFAEMFNLCRICSSNTHMAGSCPQRGRGAP